jgi:peroxiredoxin
VAKRSAFVVDRAGVIRYAWISEDPKVTPDLADIRRCLAELT